MKKSKNGFTLIELLVVIAIIALLLGILMPSLSMVKEKAKSIVCRTNLHQWGLCYQLYGNDWDGKFPAFVHGTISQVTYMESLRDYYEDVNKMRTCPSAAKIADIGWTAWRPASNIAGRTSRAWYIDASDPSITWMADDDWGVGSYGENSWIRKVNSSSQSWVSFSSIRTASEVPLILDARWNNAWVDDSLPNLVGSEPEQFNINNWSSMTNFTMRRHADGVSVAMADMSAIPIDAEELWSLKWHRDFEKTVPVDIDLSWLIW